MKKGMLPLPLLPGESQADAAYRRGQRAVEAHAIALARRRGRGTTGTTASEQHHVILHDVQCHVCGSRASWPPDWRWAGG